MEGKSSEKVLYWLVGIVIVVIVGFGGYKLWHHYNKSSAMQIGGTASAKQLVTPSPSQTTGNSGLSNKTDTSNTQLDQDLQSVQNSMNQLQQDQGTANNDVNNQSQDIPQQ